MLKSHFLASHSEIHSLQCIEQKCFPNGSRQTCWPGEEQKIGEKKVVDSDSGPLDCEADAPASQRSFSTPSPGTNHA